MILPLKRIIILGKEYKRNVIVRKDILLLVETLTVLVLQNVWTAAKSKEKKLTEMIGFISFSPQGKK